MQPNEYAARPDANRTAANRTAANRPAANRTAVAVADAEAPVAVRLEQHRVELTGYCYRMLGSSAEAEDAVQETLTRAWRSFDRFEGRSALRTWLYRIAGNVCFDALNAGKRRARPMDLTGAGSPAGPVGEQLPEYTWIEPVPDGRVLPEAGDPGDIAVARESIRLAFVAALQHLPPRQRAVLILREVLSWRAQEVAALLDTSVASVNSALQRARATLATIDLTPTEPFAADDRELRELLDRYVDAFERYDMESLTSLLHEDATQSMPPYELWLQGRDDIFQWWLGAGNACRGSRLVPPSRTAAPRSGSTGRADQEGATSRGRSRCSSWRTAGSSSAPSSSTPTSCSRSSAYPLASSRNASTSARQPRAREL